MRTYIVIILCSSTLGVYVASYDMKMEWVVIKGVSGYADGTGCESEEWMSFASAMAASLVENILCDANVFQSWPNYKGNRTRWLTPLSGSHSDCLSWSIVRRQASDV